MSPRIDLNRIQYFVSVVECKSYTKASKRLGVPKSTLSRHIQALEADLNLRLLNRSTRQLSTTHSGSQYYQSCLPLISSLQQAQNAILDDQINIKGELRITMAYEVGSSLLVDILPEFIKRYPQISFELHFSTENLNLIEEGFDLAIRIGQQLDDSSYIAKKLASPKLGLFASADYIHSHPPIKQLDDLHAHNHLLMNMGQSALYIEGRPPFVRETSALSSNSLMFNKDMCKQGLGIAMLPLVLCRQEVQSGELLPILPDTPLISPNMYAVYPSRNHPSPALTAFIDYISEQIRDAQHMKHFKDPAHPVSPDPT